LLFLLLMMVLLFRRSGVEVVVARGVRLRWLCALVVGCRVR
jgi:hypothetical protein